MNDSKSARTPWAVWCALVASLLLGCQVLFGGVEVDGLPSPDAGPQSCVVGEYRCNGEFLLSCGSKDTGWKLENTCASKDRCDDKGERCLTCMNGDYRCKGAMHQACNQDGGGWRDLGQCESEDRCSELGCVPCTPGAIDCSGESKRVLRECNAEGRWVPLEECASDGLCTASKEAGMNLGLGWSRKCEAPGCDKAGAYECQGLRLRRCRQDRTGWDDLDVCLSSALCAATAEQGNASDGATTFMCIDGCDVAGSFKCDGMNLLQCRPDLVDYDLLQTCPENTQCNPTQGLCGPLCTPGEYQCNGSVLRQCQANREWTTGEDCLSSALCQLSEDKKSGSCGIPECKAGAYSCENGVLRKCGDDLRTWVPQATCGSQDLCNVTSMRCDPIICPVAGARRCTGQVLEECSTGLDKWNTVQTCAAGSLCNTDPTAGPACLTDCPSATRCNGKTLETCTKAAGWTASATCATEDLCNCTLDPDGPGPLTHSCVAGIYHDGCGKVLCGGTRVGFQCQGAELQKCQAGRNGWERLETCSSAANCLASDFSGYCAQCPAAGELECMGSAPGSTLRVCSADRRAWNNQEVCSQFGCVATASGPDYCARCNVGDAQCAGATLQQCAVDRSRLITQTCASAGLCDAPNRQCDLCERELSMCSGNTLNTCSTDGQVPQSQLCPTRCDATAGECDSCIANTARCSNGTLYRCNPDGQDETPTTCVTSALCNDPLDRCDPPTCDVGATQCTGAQPQICNAGRNGWDDAGAACVTAELCNANGTCTAPLCELGERQCLGLQPQTCDPATRRFVNSGAACQIDCIDATGTCAMCTAGTLRCSGTQPEICNTAGTDWSANGMVCPAGAPCENGACQWACTTGQTRCLDGVLQTCNSARTGFDPTPCDAGQYCAQESNAPAQCRDYVCSANQPDCDGAQPRRCNATGMAWDPVGGACDSAELCNAATASCDACMANQRRCQGNNLQTCTGAPLDWETTQACGPSLCDRTALECDDCKEGDVECVEGETPSFRTCDADGHWTLPAACPSDTTCDVDTGEGVAATP